MRQFYIQRNEAHNRVSIHAPGRGATGQRYKPYCLHQGFNSRTREGCDTLHTAGQVKRTCFNSRTREGCDALFGEVLTPCFVSIHAPGRGATHCDCYLLCFVQVSIHAPGRGATATAEPDAVELRCFNSRTREGCDSASASVISPAMWFQFTHPGGVRL